MFFFLQQLSVRSITAPSLCHCNVHGFPGKHNSSRWPLAIAQRDRKKLKSTKFNSKRQAFVFGALSFAFWWRLGAVSPFAGWEVVQHLPWIPTEPQEEAVLFQRGVYHV